MKTKPDPNSLLGHLIELRNRILRSVIAVLLVFLCLAYFARDIYALLAKPLLAVLPEGTSMIATDVAAPFFAPFKLTFMVSICLAIPYILLQVWQFIAPALYSREKRLMAPLVASSTLLFYGGIAFAYFIVFPLVFAFFTSVAPEGVTIATDITSYLDFVLKLFFAFGLSFEIPIAILLLVWSGSVSRATLAEKRPYIIVGAFILGMLLTPPDVLSQTLLAIPMWMLFEVGLWLSRFYEPKADNSAADNTEEQQP
ncbi:twin-arginine translocase subunit TatC [Alishewanella sp. 16-MA]|uniref:Sec-independent protein translocase protein TatC n=1 Tax=Alishewanella maricola TaxID=2795740 RepID=A0ABS8C4P4_9ALTE|nr:MULTISPECIES: twin-arginine translocase subunit TatC [Alishewanella]MDP4945642.1 twin-arginine translocase subunit TatC [Alishewanella sp.]MCB5227292.1 twin-arginine translocase subunit TatC [Alishewanella maricola]MDP5035001.1 twin-arginine translocase subunit TatC [Alishewanella sp.]MDP5186895.1 twin-arginine translocase subunit TatC [Alishewanella sp.]MDP5460575.1 twin-arginine translocase subunit TatC [Alishewanella sp. SMS8]